MQQQNVEEKDPPKLRIILPLVAVILLLTALFGVINLSKSSYVPMTTLELGQSFVSYAAKQKAREHYRLFVSHKKVSLPPGPSLAEFLQGVEGADLISSVELTYEIPVFINLTGDWIFTAKDSDFFVQAPFPSFGEPVFDSTSLVVTFKSDISEEKRLIIQDALKENLSAYRIAIDPKSQAQLESESRENVKTFLVGWLTSTFKNLPDFKYQIGFIGSNAEPADNL